MQTQAGDKFTFTGRVRSIRLAVRGIKLVLMSQHNAWVHAATTVLACATGVLLGISRAEWCLIVLAIISVWTAESLNTALEFLCDVSSPDFHPLVEKAKDIAAGSVLICAIGAVIIGVLVFTPHVVALVQRAT